MSASQEKKRRRDQREEGTEKRQVQKKQNYVQRKRNRRIGAIAGAVAAVLIVFIVVVNSNLFYRYVTAVKVGDESFTAADFNYYYFSSYYNYYTNAVETYGDYYSYFVPDTNTPLSSQSYSDTQTWADYFEESALSSMKSMTMLMKQAGDAGYTLSEGGQTGVESAVSTLKSEYSSAGYSSLGTYLQALYGKGMTEAIYRRNLERSTLASEYAQIVYDSYEYSDETLDEYYQGNADTYDYINYRIYSVSGAADEEAGIDSETAMANAKAAAETIAKTAKTEEQFAEMVYEYAPEDSKATYEDIDATLQSYTGSYLTSYMSSYSEWLLDGERNTGDTTVVEYSSGYYVIFYVDREDNHYNTRSVRHILIAAQADSEGNYTDEALAAALEELEGIYEEWKNGDATEDSFAALANEHSDDGGSNTAGGLYEGIYKNQMVKEFNDWTFDISRKAGNTGIVYGSSSGYAGYHLIYYVGEGEQYSTMLADSAKRYEDYSAWHDANVAYYAVSKKLAMSFTK